MDQIFNVLYPHDGSINHTCDLKAAAYDFVYAISCADVNETFRHGQSCHNPALEFVGCRSMCIGDIVLDEKGNFFMVMPVGYRLIDDEIITFHQREEEVYS